MYCPGKINFWCRWCSRWLTFSHSSLITAIVLAQKVYICIHTMTATVHLSADKHLSECSSSWYLCYYWYKCGCCCYDCTADWSQVTAWLDLLVMHRIALNWLRRVSWWDDCLHVGKPTSCPGRFYGLMHWVLTVKNRSVSHCRSYVKAQLCTLSNTKHYKRCFPLQVILIYVWVTSTLQVRCVGWAEQFWPLLRTFETNGQWE